MAYTFEDAIREAQELGLPVQQTGFGLRIELSDKESVRCFTPEVAQEELQKAKSRRMEDDMARMDALFANLDKTEASYRKHFGPIPPITER